MSPELTDEEIWRVIQPRAARVRLAVFDVDGVLTDGSLILGDGGIELKVFHARDGQGLVMLRDNRIDVAIVSGRSAPVVAERMAALGIHHVFQGSVDKLVVLRGLARQLGIDLAETAYVGDDLPDLPPMLHVGLAVAVADAHPLVLRHAHWRTRLSGGRGAAREVCDLLLHSRGALARAHARYLDAGSPAVAGDQVPHAGP